MPGFPILRLPLVNLKDVFGILDVSDLLELSRCNKKLKCLIRSSKQITSFSLLSLPQKESMNTLDVFYLLHLQLMNGSSEFRQMNSIQLDLFVNYDIGVQFCLEENNDVKWKIYAACKSDYKDINGFESSLKMGAYNVRTILCNPNELYTFWDDRLEGLKILMSWLMKTYYFRVETLDLRMGFHGKFCEDLRSIVNFVSCNQSTFSNCIINEEIALMTDNNLKFIRDYVHVTNNYHHFGNRTEPIPHVTNYSSKELYVSLAHWFKIDNLLTANCIFIHLEFTCFTNGDLNSFVEHWQEGHLPRLKHLMVDYNLDIDLHRIVDISTIRITSEIHNGVYKSIHELIEIDRGFNITDRSQEKVATMTSEREHNYMVTSFEMMVWPDFDGYMHHDRNV